MGLSERKIKQRIGNDPRNLSWSDDKSRFSYKHMTNLGWSDTSGIGGSGLSGNPNHIAVARKVDNGGIGVARARKDGDDQAAGAGHAGQCLDGVLRRLAQAADEGSVPVSGIQAVGAKIADDSRSLSRSKIASRQRLLHSKRLASSSPAALAEILGVPVSAVTTGLSMPTSLASTTPSTPSERPSSATTLATPVIAERTADEKISTSTVSVSDYFRQKMRSKMASRASVNRSTTPTVATDMLVVKEEVKAEGGGVKWEGNRTTFVDPTLALDGTELPVNVKLQKGMQGIKVENTTIPAPLDHPTPIARMVVKQSEDKSMRKARKEAKRQLKQGAADKHAVSIPDPTLMDVEDAIGATRMVGAIKDKEGVALDKRKRKKDDAAAAEGPNEKRGSQRRKDIVGIP